MALPFDHGKEWGQMQHGGRDGLRAEGETKDEREQTPLARVLHPTPSFQVWRLRPYNRRMFEMKFCAAVETSWKNTVAGGEHHACRASRFLGFNGMVGRINFVFMLNLLLSYV